ALIADAHDAAAPATAAADGGAPQPADRRT
ncbi:MAG: hypothetical protein QOD81_4525, partial [Solirubrobacteraceae bacterium]|nr:hypothetical protein [Solirubrobacteraceae bacterium]